MFVISYPGPDRSVRLEQRMAGAGRLYLFQRKGGRYLRYDEGKNQKDDDSKVGDLSLHLPDPYGYLPGFDDLRKRVNRPASFDRSKRTIHDLDVITTIASVQIKTALSDVLRALDKVTGPCREWRCAHLDGSHLP